MTDKDHAPLTTSCARALIDKLYEKRKSAALEIERLVKDLSATSQLDQIKKLLKVLEEYAVSQNPNIRKGGLIGLAAVAIGLGKDSCSYINNLVRPVVVCFHDGDSRVQYYACEALYNIVKVSRGAVLPHFNDIFDGLSKLTAHPDQNVKNGAELLDRLIKDIVTESSSFDLVAFIPLLRERIYTKNTFARQFIVSWIEVLDAVPDINMLALLPEILDGLFQILGDNSHEIRKMCQGVLAEFLEGIKRSKNGVNVTAMANILIVHSQNTDDLIQFTAITWLREFIAYSGRAMLPHTAGILSAVLPCLAYNDENRKKVREAAESLNQALRKLVETQDDQPTPTAEVISFINELDKTDKTSLKTNSAIIQLEILPVIKVLQRLLTHETIQARVASLKWFNLLLVKTPNKTFRYIETFFGLLMTTLADPSDDVVLLDLEVLSEISSNPTGFIMPPGSSDGTVVSPERASFSDVKLNPYFFKLMNGLIDWFKKDKQLLEDRGAFIIRQLSIYLSAEAIFHSLSEILILEEDVAFACTVVQSLNTILLTSTEIYELRSQLRELSTEESCSLFCCLYKCWCHSPISLMSLCYLTQNYAQAYRLMQIFGDLEVTVDFLKEIDKLVQLIESPIFAYLRLQLLEAHLYPELIKSLYGLLMMLPQSEAFKLLRCRLECIPQINLTVALDTDQKKRGEERPLVKKINFDELLEHFLRVQAKHREHKRNQVAYKIAAARNLR
ncbi:protein VAC14 homolog [Biomphalaria glabrata]|uniref:Protein VAC14 homolog n=1 Tax=Biomphalaria glabrata TaxID=6526 RepID=A0A9W3AYF2_BIOGL|nr:protein VAC14 homolog [Biomphalaria glabrata]